MSEVVTPQHHNPDKPHILVASTNKNNNYSLIIVMVEIMIFYVEKYWMSKSIPSCVLSRKI